MEKLTRPTARQSKSRVFINANGTHKAQGLLRTSVHAWVVGTLSAFFCAVAVADTPNVQTPSPVIFLSDNLNEPDNLGWCIDTLGRGFAENLQAHSCKPRGGDVQFTYLPNKQSIASVAFENKCMVLNAADSAVTFSLVDCDASAPAQRFQYDTQTGFISPSNNKDLCVAVGDSIRQAGPFSSRDLLLLNCTTTELVQISWTVKD